MTATLLIHHAARRGDHAYPANSLPALEHCLAAGARVVEVDVSPLQDSDFLLAHDEELAHLTTAEGLVRNLAPEQVGSLRLTWHGQITPYPPALLSQALALVEECDTLLELQLDLKTHAPTTASVLERLVRMTRPVQSHIRISSGADWALRRLRILDPDLPLGFDPLFYLDYDESPAGRSETVPFQVGAYGYLDDHPLASVRWGPAAAYLRQRAEALWVQAPAGCVWYIHARLLLQALDDGFDWIAALHERGVEVDAWTLDPHRTDHVHMARRLAAIGVDRITSNDPPGLAAALGGDVAF